ncbi:MAG: hypothetical protein NXI18_03625 [Alphaproteobacteria bacterium]|nr:hypothetical protein [Alphaproteobacteria bacterium]
MRLSAVRLLSMLVALLVLAAAPASADIRWSQDKNGAQTVFMGDGNRWQFKEPAHLRVNLNANGAGRSEWIRWNTAASDQATVTINRQTGRGFRYQSVLDYFDEDPGKRGAKRKGELMSVATSKGIVKAVSFDLSYKGYDRDCIYFSVEGNSRRVLLKGHLCEERDGTTPIEAVRDFVEALEFRPE